MDSWSLHGSPDVLWEEASCDNFLMRVPCCPVRHSSLDSGSIFPDSMPNLPRRLLRPWSLAGDRPDNRNDSSELLPSDETGPSSEEENEDWDEWDD